MKICSRCKIEKDESEFTKKASSKDGLYSWCRVCSRLYQKVIDSKPESKKKKRDYYLQNKSKILECGKEYRVKVGRDVMNAYQRKYLKTEKGKIADSRSEHKSRIKHSKKISTLTARQWGNIIGMQHGKCAVCGIEFSINNKPTKDCIIPLSGGGCFEYGNVQALCFSCNSKKSAYNPLIDLFAVLI